MTMCAPEPTWSIGTISIVVTFDDTELDGCELADVDDVQFGG